MPAPGTPVASTMTSMRGSVISAIASSVRYVARFLCASASEDAAYKASGQFAVLSWLRARPTSRSATPTTCMPAVSRACDRNMVPNFPAPITPTVTGRPSASRSSNLPCRFMRDAPSRMARRKHRRPLETSGRGSAVSAVLLAENPRNESLVVAFRPAIAARQQHFGRTNFGGRHVDALAGLKTFRLARVHGHRHAVRRAVGRDGAFFMHDKRARIGDTHHRIGRALGGIDRRFGGDAGFAAEILDLRTRILEIGIEVRGLLAKPVEEIFEEIAIFRL